MGLSYSVYSYFTPFQQAGPFQIGLQTRGDQAEEALAVVREVLAEFVADGPTEQELDGAKQNHHRWLRAAHRQQPQDSRLSAA